MYNQNILLVIGVCVFIPNILPDCSFCTSKTGFKGTRCHFFSINEYVSDDEMSHDSAIRHSARCISCYPAPEQLTDPAVSLVRCPDRSKKMHHNG